MLIENEHDGLSSLRRETDMDDHEVRPCIRMCLMRREATDCGLLYKANPDHFVRGFFHSIGRLRRTVVRIDRAFRVGVLASFTNRRNRDAPFISAGTSARS